MRVSTAAASVLGCALLATLAATQAEGDREITVRWLRDDEVAGESWTDSELDPLALENLHVQQVVVARCGDRVGHGVIEQMHVGPSPSYGFADWFDGA